MRSYIADYKGYFLNTLFIWKKDNFKVDLNDCTCVLSNESLNDFKSALLFFYNEDSEVSLAQKNKTEPANQQQQQHKKTSLLAPAIVQIGVSFYFSIL